MDGTPRRLKLRYPATCSVCGTELGRGADAWWDSEEKKAACLVCGSGADLARELGGTAGASGRQEYERRIERREREVRGRFGRRLGGVVLALSDDPPSTRAWGVGASGEERLSRFVERERPASAICLHDWRIPGSKANIDHIVVAASGVWVVDAKLYTGKVERRTLGPFWRPEAAVFVGGRNRTKIVHGLPKQVEAVRSALASDARGRDPHLPGRVLRRLGLELVREAVRSRRRLRDMAAEARRAHRRPEPSRTRRGCTDCEPDCCRAEVRESRREAATRVRGRALRSVYRL